jgi:hypothetical protein
MSPIGTRAPTRYEELGQVTWEAVMYALALTTARLATIGLAAILTSMSAQAATVTFSGAGANPASIQAVVDAYRADLGTLNPNVAGSSGSGRREINWDGVPDALAAPNNLPPNFFNVNSPRGVEFSTPGTGFQVSATTASGNPVQFGNINPTYPTLFETFSPQRLFTAIGSNLVDVNFFVPGSNTPALTNGFGAVFTDVDLANTTSLTFFDSANNSLGTFFVPVSVGNEGLSFLGVDFGSAVVSRVRIVSGNAALGPNETAGLDLVVMDDFIYGEPINATGAVPELSTWAMMILGFCGIGFMTYRRKSTAARAAA